MIDVTLANARASGEGLGVQYVHWATAVLSNGLGRHALALKHARLASEDTPELFVSAWALSELVEAAIRKGIPIWPPRLRSASSQRPSHRL